MNIKQYVDGIHTIPREYRCAIAKLFIKVHKDKNLDDAMQTCQSMMNQFKYKLNVLFDTKNIIVGICLYKHDCTMYENGIIRVSTLIVGQRGKGYAAVLLKEFDSRTVVIDCHVDNDEGQRFYESRGFKRSFHVYIR